MARPISTAVVTLASGAAGFAVSLVVYVFLGMLTGVVAMCASAPDWWILTYVIAGIVLVPAGSAAGAVYGRRRYCRAR
jgi:hypothetical protein